MKKIIVFGLFSWMLSAVPFFHSFVPQGQKISLDNIPSSCKAFILEHQGLSSKQMLRALYTKAVRLELDNKEKEAKELSDCVLIIMHKEDHWLHDNHTIIKTH